MADDRLTIYVEPGFSVEDIPAGACIEGVEIRVGPQTITLPPGCNEHGHVIALAAPGPITPDSAPTCECRLTENRRRGD